MKVKAPKGGYDFKAKQEYREKVWDHLTQSLDSDSNGDCVGRSERVLFFPSTEGLEIPIALRMGLTQENLIAVDDNPNAVLKSEWRKKYPDIKFYGGKLSKVIPIMEKDGLKFQAANLDFCNNLSADLMEEFNSFVCSNVLGRHCDISLTVMNGRESSSTNLLADLLFKNMNTGIGRNYEGRFFGFKNKRLTAVVGNTISRLNSLDRYVSFDGDKSYMSGNIKMSYGLMAIFNRSWLEESAGITLSKSGSKNVIKRAETMVNLVKKHDILNVEDADGKLSRYILINLRVIGDFIGHMSDSDGTLMGDANSLKGMYGIENFTDWKVDGLESLFDKTMFKDVADDLCIFRSRQSNETIKTINRIVDDMNFWSILDSKYWKEPCMMLRTKEKAELF